MAQELCQCQSATHGHEPGKCAEPATEADGMCKRCHDAAEADTSANPTAFGTAPSGLIG
jgi:hypothetical protein